MILEIILWVLFGALVGWIASMIMGTNEEQGALENIGVGIIGAFIGGLVFRLFGGEGVTGFNLYSVIVALLGALVFLWILRLFRTGRRDIT